MAKSVCILGKIQHARVTMPQITNIFIESNNCDLIVETSLPQDGKRAWQYVSPSSDTEGTKLANYKLRVTGQNHLLHILNRFNLVYVEVTITGNGAR